MYKCTNVQNLTIFTNFTKLIAVHFYIALIIRKPNSLHKKEAHSP